MGLPGGGPPTLALFAPLTPVTRAFLFARMAVAPLGPMEGDLRTLHGRFLSLGCGHGAIDRYIAEINPDVSIEGVDSTGTRRAGAATEHLAPRVRVEAADVTTLDPGDGYDGALAVDVLHHVPFETHATIAAALLRALKPGGTLLLKDMAPEPRRQYLWNRSTTASWPARSRSTAGCPRTWPGCSRTQASRCRTSDGCGAWASIPSTSSSRGGRRETRSRHRRDRLPRLPPDRRAVRGRVRGARPRRRTAPGGARGRPEFVRADVRDRDAMRRAAPGCDVVVDNAALVPVTRSTAQGFRSVNLDGCKATLDAARAAGAYVVHVSSSSIYGMPDRIR